VGDEEILFEFLLIWCVIRLVEFNPTAIKKEYQIRKPDLIHLINISQSQLVRYLQPFLQEEHTHSLLMTSETVIYLMITNPTNKPKDEKKINQLHYTIEIIPNGSLTALILGLLVHEQ